MSFPILFAGWFLVAWACSWPINIAAEVAAVKFVRGSIEPINFAWNADALSRAVWSIIFAAGATLVSTADLGWSP